MTPRPHHSDETTLLARALSAVSAYGADLLRWPQEARATAEALEGHPTFALALSEARALDDALAAPAPKPSEDLAARILESAPSRPLRAGGLGIRLSGLFAGRRMIPAGALACLSALGFASGLASAARYPGGEEALIYAEAAVATAFEEDAPWAVEE